MCDIQNETDLHRPDDPHPHAVTLADVLAEING